ASKPIASKPTGKVPATVTIAREIGLRIRRPPSAAFEMKSRLPIDLARSGPRARGTPPRVFDLPTGSAASGINRDYIDDNLGP
ncbi:hypothetical protein ACYOEI_14945, partial [Singulisphaera rosea]